MVEIQDAITILEENCTQLAPQNKPLTQVSQCVLAEDIFSPINMPHFRQSAMDGFAICRNDELVYQIVDVLYYNVEHYHNNPEQHQ